VTQAEEHLPLRRIDRYIRAGDRRSSGNVHPRGSRIQSIGLRLQDPAQVIGRPGHIQISSARAEGDVRRIARSRRPDEQAAAASDKRG